MGTEFVMKFHRYMNNRASLSSKFNAHLFDSLWWRGHRGSKRPMGGLTKLGFQTPNDGDDSSRGAQGPKEKLTAGGFGECQLSAGVNGAQVIQILRSRRQPKQSFCIGSDLQAHEAVKGKFSDAVLHGNSY